MLLGHSSVLTRVEIRVSILWTILYVMSRLLTPIAHIRVRELVDRLSTKLSREAKLAPLLIAYGLQYLAIFLSKLADIELLVDIILLSLDLVLESLIPVDHLII